MTSKPKPVAGSRAPPDFNTDANGNPTTETYDKLSLREYLYDRTRYGFAGALDHRLTGASDLYVHGLFSNFRDYGQKYEYDFKPKSVAFHTGVRRPNVGHGGTDSANPPSVAVIDTYSLTRLAELPGAHCSGRAGVANTALALAAVEGRIGSDASALLPAYDEVSPVRQ